MYIVIVTISKWISWHNVGMVSFPATENHFEERNPTESPVHAGWF